MVNNIWDKLFERGERLQTLPGALKFLRRTNPADNIVLMGGDNNYSEESFTDFEDTVFENYASNNNARIFASREYREDIEESNKIHEDSVFFFEYPGESYQISDIFVNSYDGDETVAFGPQKYMKELDDALPDKVKGFYRE